MIGYMNPLQKIQAQEELLKSEKSFSPQERKFLKQEIAKERQSVERMSKRLSMGSSGSPIKPYTKNETAFDLREKMKHMQNSSKKLNDFYNEQTLGRGGVPMMADQLF